MNQPILIAQNLTKKFKSITAVDSVSFEIYPNTIVALLGGNGAGKTTTMAMLLGLVTPSKGHIEILGQDFESNRFKTLNHMNFSSPYLDLPHRLSVEENLLIYALLYAIKKPKKKLTKLAHDLGIEKYLKTPVGKLSSGQRTRVALAKALINNPSILLLDEPTASLDPETADWIRQYLKKWRKENNSTILLASHNMSEVERLADKVIMLKQGRVIAIDSPKGLMETYGQENLEEVFLAIAKQKHLAKT
ncbi:MAG: ABC transporter [Alphaproteobacteria bacterium]|nr:ABC transporter [Alphaproteobacteria bacterium]|tara:strand:- start:158 stop:901 length:744 start_codon:yes stop_codon:yes gene_type:complete